MIKNKMWKTKVFDNKMPYCLAKEIRMFLNRLEIKPEQVQSINITQDGTHFNAIIVYYEIE